MEPKTLLDIVIPVYNEGANITRVLDNFAAMVKTPIRVFIAYDFDEDDTLPAVKNMQLRLPFDVVFLKNKYRGVHGAVRTGLEASQAPAIIVIPADDTYNTHLIDRMFEKFKAGCDIVAPSRFARGGCMKGCPWIKGLFVILSSYSLHIFGRIPVHDATNGFRLFSRRVIETVSIESDEGFTFSIELLVKCHRLGWKIEELPALWFERTQGRSRFQTFGWLKSYLRWYLYGFATSYLFCRHVRLNEAKIS